MTNNKKDNDYIKLKVGELSDRGDFGRGIVRLPSKIMKKLHLKEGDIVELKGRKKTGAVVVRSYPADAGLEIVRMDGLMRKNCGTSISEMISIKKAEEKEAQSVTIAPLRENVIIRASGGIFKKNLIMRSVFRGDIIIPNPVVKRRRGGEDVFGTPFDDLFKSFGIDVNMGMGGFTTFGEEKFTVVNTKPNGVVRITENTQIQVSEKAQKPVPEAAVSDVTYEDIGGLHKQIDTVREMIELPLRHPELFDKLGIEPPKGVLMKGPPGTGKTLLAKAVANESGANFHVINGPEVVSKFYGESEANLRKIFKDAEKNAPSIIFIDEIDAIAGKRSETKGEVERRMVSQLLTLLDGLKSRGKVIVIAASNIADEIDPALRRPGRLDREIEIGVPDKKGRKEILEIHTRGMPLSKGIDLDRIAQVTYGYVGADLEALAKEAAMHALRRTLPDLGALDKERPLSEETLKKLKVKKADFNYGLKMVEPSAMREVLVEVPRVRWKDIGGLKDVKQDIKESVEWPLKYPGSFERMGIESSRGILLYGPPGCGKTLLAKAVANESDSNFILVKAGELLSKWFGESEKHVREVFKRAKQVAPSVIFFDEIDALAGVRGGGDGGREVTGRVVSQILTEMSGLEDLHDVVVIAATNRPDIVDPALLRPGRFDKQILVPTPDEGARKQIFKIHTKNTPLDSGVNLKKLAESTNGYSGADIAAICREAAMYTLRKNKKAKKVTKEDFDKALKESSASVSREMNEVYEKMLGKRKENKIEKEVAYTG